MRGPYNAQYRKDSQPTTGSARRSDPGPNVDEAGFNRLQRRPDPAARGRGRLIERDVSLRGKARRNARKAARR